MSRHNPFGINHWGKPGTSTKPKVSDSTSSHLSDPVISKTSSLPDHHHHHNLRSWHPSLLSKHDSAPDLRIVSRLEELSFHLAEVKNSVDNRDILILAARANPDYNIGTEHNSAWRKQAVVDNRIYQSVRSQIAVTPVDKVTKKQLKDWEARIDGLLPRTKTAAEQTEEKDQWGEHKEDAGGNFRQSGWNWENAMRERPEVKDVDTPVSPKTENTSPPRGC